MLRSQWADDAQFSARFRQEARAAANLRHPNIVTIHDTGEVDGQLYIAMEYLPGRTLHNVLEEQGALSLEAALPILEQLADALDYAHSQGMIHRDVKPLNVMVEDTARGPHATLMDFGLVKALESSTALTSQGTLLGSPEYMAPEQADPNRHAEIGPATDRYALGIVAYRIFTGRVPFPGNTPGTLNAHLNLMVPDPRDFVRDLPPEVTAALLTMLAKAPADRFPTASAFVARLQKAPATKQQRHAQTARTKAARPSLSAWYWLGAVGIVLALLAIIVMQMLNSGARSIPTPTSRPNVTATWTLSPKLTATSRPNVTATWTLSPKLTATSTPQVLMDSMRIVFYGYLNQQPKSGMAIISSDGISNITDVTFLRVGGEISPDGNFIAFDSCVGEDREIDIVKIDGSGIRTVAPVSGDYCVDIRWSTDGKKLSYNSPVDELLHIIQIDTGIDTALSGTSVVGWHSWSPSGDEIVYEQGIGGERQLYIIDMNGNIRQLISLQDFGGCEPRFPTWSPGSRIAFTSCEDKLYVISPDGTNLQQLAESAYSPRWSSDGEWVLFLSDQTLMRVYKNGTSLTVIGILPYSGAPFSVGPLK